MPFKNIKIVLADRNTIELFIKNFTDCIKTISNDIKTYSDIVCVRTFCKKLDIIGCADNFFVFSDGLCIPYEIYNINIKDVETHYTIFKEDFFKLLEKTIPAMSGNWNNVKNESETSKNKKKSTQMGQQFLIIKHLETGKPITSLESFKLYNIQRLAAIIFNIKKTGRYIGKRTVFCKETGKNVIEYYLSEEKIEYKPKRTESKESIESCQNTIELFKAISLLFFRFSRFFDKNSGFTIDIRKKKSGVQCIKNKEELSQKMLVISKVFEEMSEKEIYSLNNITKEISSDLIKYNINYSSFKKILSELIDSIETVEK